MGIAEIKLLDSLEHALLKQQRAINSQLKLVQKHENKLTKTLQKQQKKQAKKNERETTPSVIQYREELERQKKIKTQLEEKLSTIELKIIELKKRKAVV